MNKVWLPGLRKKLTLLASLTLVFSLNSFSSHAEDGDYWISMAEKSCIFEGNYTVDVQTGIFSRTQDKRTGKTSETQLGSSEQRLQYTPSRGLTHAQTGNSAGGASAKRQGSGFILDVGNMLKKMQGKAKWGVENESETLDGTKCVVISSSGEKWLVRLWISVDDGTVIRYDQYLNGKHIGSSVIKYEPPNEQKYLPAEATTQFHLTGQLFVQKYRNYSLAEVNKGTN